ncbi:MAG: SurA N-terminal domain-containing protein [Candidatus Saccharibacteria bacterium]|nr:SurA N-terminal domain-containing protein [Candidatus Saccharibacteria bacterium]
MAILKKKEQRKTERQKVEERREEVLSNGRKYKYPMQFAKHRVVIWTLIVVVLALVSLGALGYVLLYKAQDTSDIIYRVTQVLPVRVATIDGEPVRYSDYLMIYRSTMTPLEQQEDLLSSSADMDAMRAFYKRQALTEAEDYTYALKLMRELHITISDNEITDAINNHRKAGGVERSEETFRRILQENFGLSMSEYRRMVYLALAKQKVSEVIDSVALATAVDVEKRIASGKTLSDIAKEMGSQVLFEETGGLVDAMNIDGGRATVARTLEPGKTSGRFTSNSGSGYYFVTLGNKTDTEVSYTSIQVPFKEFDTRVQALRNDNKVEEKIEVEETNTELEQNPAEQK